MPKYNIEAMRSTYYYIPDLEADSIEEAGEMVFSEKLPQDIETYAVDWEPMEVTDIMEAE